jgi:hypothetical protein
MIQHESVSATACHRQCEFATNHRHLYNTIHIHINQYTINDIQHSIQQYTIKVQYIGYNKII